MESKHGGVVVITLLYAPTIYRHDKGLWPPTDPSTYYYQHQKKMFDFFSTLDIQIIWSAGPRTSNLIDPIQFLNSENIDYKSGQPINKLLKKCDLVFVDYPSTVVYDSIKMGKPVLCCYPITDEKWVRQNNFKSQCVSFLASNNYDAIFYYIKRFVRIFYNAKCDIRLNKNKMWFKEILNAG